MSASARLLQPVFGTSAEAHARMHTDRIKALSHFTFDLLMQPLRSFRSLVVWFAPEVSMRTKMAVVRGNDKAVVKKRSSKRPELLM